MGYRKRRKKQVEAIEEVFDALLDTYYGCPDVTVSDFVGMLESAKHIVLTHADEAIEALDRMDFDDLVELLGEEG